MAADKKSFVLYADLIKSIDHLTNEEKGILFNHLLEYVNDKKPVLEDRLILTAWKPIELQLKRDLIKFEEVKVKRSEAGKRSAELRALKSEKQNSTNSTSVESVKQCSTNSTVNDNVNDNVNVNVNVINKDNSIDSRKLKFAHTIREFSGIYPREMLNDFYSYWTETNDNGKKFRREMQKTWNLKLRLSKWDSNNTNFNKNKNGQQINDTDQFKQIAQAIGSDGVRR